MSTWILVIVCVVFFIIMTTIDFIISKKTWNNGYCECGGKWIHTYSLDDYHFIYKCDKCGKEIIMNKFIEE